MEEAEGVFSSSASESKQSAAWECGGPVLDTSRHSAVVGLLCAGARLVTEATAGGASLQAVMLERSREQEVGSGGKGGEPGGRGRSEAGIGVSLREAPQGLEIVICSTPTPRWDRDEGQESQRRDHSREVSAPFEGMSLSGGEHEESRERAAPQGSNLAVGRDAKLRPIRVLS
eukprot:scaffold29819_cov31-Tisochrysis_lutea.AAC.2